MMLFVFAVDEIVKPPWPLKWRFARCKQRVLVAWRKNVDSSMVVEVGFAQ